MAPSLLQSIQLNMLKYEYFMYLHQMHFTPTFDFKAFEHITGYLY